MYFQHSVKYQGETLASIADWYTGDSRNWKTIARANPSIKPERIRIGDIINIPPELVKKTKPYPKPDVRSKPKNEAPQANPVENKEEAASSNASEQSDDTSAAPSSDTSDASDAAPANEETSTTTSNSDSAPAEQADAAMNPPADENSAPSDEAEREKLREKTRLELLQDVLKSDNAEAPAPEAAAK